MKSLGQIAVSGCGSGHGTPMGCQFSLMERCPAAGNPAALAPTIYLQRKAWAGPRRSGAQPGLSSGFCLGQVCSVFLLILGRRPKETPFLGSCGFPAEGGLSEPELKPTSLLKPELRGCGHGHSHSIGQSKSCGWRQVGL